MRRARTVTLYLVSPHFWPMRALDEGRLKQAACEYTTTDAALIASLADVVEDAHLHSATTWISIEPREAIYLTLGGGSEIRLLFDRAYQNQPELAGSVDGQVVMVRSSFVEMLYRWAAKLNSLGTCEHFLDKYR
ncbi:hypothetical protein R20233_00385 [Ralstonia sp. LMG 32965]|nr:hypothetical protein R20233_00385 [Ralstonia sp. LMG 32965]